MYHVINGSKEMGRKVERFYLDVPMILMVLYIFLSIWVLINSVSKPRGFVLIRERSHMDLYYKI